MSELTRGERLQIMLTAEELQAVDDWRFTRRMPSRAAAVRELLRRGLEAEGFSTARLGQKSESFGVVPDARANSSADGAEGLDAGDAVPEEGAATARRAT